MRGSYADEAPTRGGLAAGAMLMGHPARSGLACGSCADVARARGALALAGAMLMWHPRGVPSRGRELC